MSKSLEDVTFDKVLDKILHATINYESIKEINSNGIAFVIKLTGKERDGKEWEVGLNAIIFCKLALEFLDNKILCYNAAP